MFKNDLPTLSSIVASHSQVHPMLSRGLQTQQLSVKQHCSFHWLAADGSAQRHDDVGCHDVVVAESLHITKLDLA